MSLISQTIAALMLPCGATAPLLPGRPAWRPSHGYVDTTAATATAAAGPDPVDGADDDEGGIDIELAIARQGIAIELQELSLDVDIAAALAAWTPDDWHAVHSQPPAGCIDPTRLHTFLFDHQTLVGLTHEPAPAAVVLPQDC